MGVERDHHTGPRVERMRSRTIHDERGRAWVVQEVRDTNYDRRGTLSLVFSTDDAMRRVRCYPANWFELSDTELMALSRLT